MSETARIEQNIPTVYIQSLLGRYIMILLKYELTNSRKQQIGKIFLEALTKFIQKIKESRKEQKLDDTLLFLISHICGDFNRFFLINSPPNKFNRFIQKEFYEILHSLFKVLSPPSYFKRPVSIGKKTGDEKFKEKYDYLKLFY